MEEARNLKRSSREDEVDFKGFHETKEDTVAERERVPKVRESFGPLRKRRRTEHRPETGGKAKATVPASNLAFRQTKLEKLQAPADYLNPPVTYSKEVEDLFKLLEGIVGPIPSSSKTVQEQGATSLSESDVLALLGFDLPQSASGSTDSGGHSGVKDPALAAVSSAENKRTLPRVGADIVKTQQTNTVPVKTNKKELVFAYGKVDVSREDLDRLEPKEYLNDTLVEFCLRFWHNSLKETNPSLFDNIWIFNSFFYKKLRESKGYENVRKWTRTTNIFTKSVIVVPINLKKRDYEHWYLAVIHWPGAVLPGGLVLQHQARVFILDSLNQRHPEAATALWEWLDLEAQNKQKQKALIPIENTYHVKVPGQHNGFDCGLYMLHYAETFVSNIDTIIPFVLDPTLMTSGVEVARILDDGNLTKKREMWKERTDKLVDDWRSLSDSEKKACSDEADEDEVQCLEG